MKLAKTSPASGDLSNDARLPRAPPVEIRNDRESLTALATQHLPRVRNLIRYLVRGDQDVDDIAQEALLAVLRGLSSYRGRAPFESWVDRVVARVTFAWLRRRNQQRPFGLESKDDVSTDETTMADEYVRRRHLVRLLDQLPEDQRYALVLHHVLGLSVIEIALETGAKAETVRTRLRLGRQRLRTLADPDSANGERAHE
jgi:RNA polymerase sigma-70 factor, ECF subfamily